MSGPSEKRLRDLANLYEAAMRRGNEEIDDPDNPIQAKILEILQQHDFQNKAEKRASCKYKRITRITIISVDSKQINHKKN